MLWWRKEEARGHKVDKNGGWWSRGEAGGGGCGRRWSDLHFFSFFLWLVRMVGGGVESGILCKVADTLIKSEVYSDYVQDHLAPSGYLKIPNNMNDYLDKCKFLPKLNNEVPGERNLTYKKRFSTLQNLVLIMSEQDTVLVPKETSWFGYYSDNSFNIVLPAQQTKLYAEDWIGLRTLDEAGRVKFVRVTGAHVAISDEDMKEHMVPYLKSN
ncbi:hypothetical protein KSS87_023650 [Heliosperma pusillum]|nr:hypothetical protein KSS87_023650 [Heliosperma pusillum]